MANKYRGTSIKTREECKKSSRAEKAILKG